MENTLTTHEGDLPEERLKLAEVYLVPTSDGGLTMRSPRRSAVLRGKLVTEIFPRLLPLLDGTRTRAQVLEELSAVSDAPNLAGALGRLIDLGVIDVVPHDATPEWPERQSARMSSQARFFAQYGGDATTMPKVARSRVLVAGEGPLVPAIALGLSSSGVARITVAARRPVSAADVAQSQHLREDDIGRPMGDAVRRLVDGGDMGTEVQELSGFPETMLDWQAHLTSHEVAALALDAPVVTVPWLDEFNKAALASATPWTSGALLQRATVHVGPSVIPGQTACWKCFEYRFKSNIGSVVRYEEFQAYVSDLAEYVDHGNLPSVSAFTGSLVALEAIRLIVSDQVYVQTAGSLLTIDLWEYRLDTHPVLKLPRCPHCSPVHFIPQERTWS